MNKLTHINEAGEAQMVDVGAKPETERRATATGKILMQPQTLALIETGGHKKGDVLAVARVAGVMAAKKTAELIPLCHPLALDSVELSFTVVANPPSVICTVTAKTLARTGVEMEALIAVQAALATIYDMCKAVDRGMLLTDIGVTAKSGGRSGDWTRGQ